MQAPVAVGVPFYGEALLFPEPCCWPQGGAVVVRLVRMGQVRRARLVLEAGGAAPRGIQQEQGQEPGGLERPVPVAQEFPILIARLRQPVVPCIREGTAEAFPEERLRMRGAAVAVVATTAAVAVRASYSSVRATVAVAVVRLLRVPAGQRRPVDPVRMVMWGEWLPEPAIRNMLQVLLLVGAVILQAVLAALVWPLCNGTVPI